MHSVHYSFSVFIQFVFAAVYFRDIVHRQIAMDSVAHLTLGVYGFGCDDALIHIFNYVWPNMLENSPHVIQR